MEKFVILLNGVLHVTDRLIAQTAGSRIIAADGGILHADALGVEPELWVGDFDSTDEVMLKRYRHLDREEHIREKDETDGAIAIAHALERGAREIVLAGATGGRMDHALSHLTQMLALYNRGVSCFASSGHEEVWPLGPGELSLDAPAGCHLSIIGFGELVGLSLSGVQWPLENRDVAEGSSLTVSNETTGHARISLVKGRGLVILTLDD